MTQLSRRHAIAGLGAVVAASVTRSPSAKAAEPVTVWWTQGFYEAENKAVIDNLAAWEKSTGTKVNLTSTEWARPDHQADRSNAGGRRARPRSLGDRRPISGAAHRHGTTNWWM